MKRLVTPIFVGTLLVGALLTTGCQTHVVESPYASYTGMRPIPTRVEQPPPPPESGSSFPNPFRAIGNGIANLLPSKKPGSGMQINSPTGQSTQVPPGFSGQTMFSASDGKSYRLNFKDGALVGVEPQPAPPPK